MADRDQQLLLALAAHRGPWNDCAPLHGLVRSAHQVTPVGLVPVDADFESVRNHTYIRQQLKASSIIPARRGKRTWYIHGVRAEMRRAFPQHQYARRSLVESVFGSAKRKLSARAPGRTLFKQRRQALLLGLAFNLYRLWRRTSPIRGWQQSLMGSRERWQTGAET